MIQAKVNVTVSVARVCLVMVLVSSLTVVTS